MKRWVTFINILAVLFLLSYVAQVLMGKWGTVDGSIDNPKALALFSIFRFLIVFTFLRPRVSRMKRKSLIVFFITISSFVFLEFLSRIIIPSNSSFDQLYPTEVVRVPHPFIMFKGKSFGQLYPDEILNIFGYRGRAPTLKKNDSEYRIFILGGSTVFVGDPSIAENLERLFHEGGYNNVKCFNWGVVSSVSGMELARVVFEVIDHEPDMVVFYNGGNDMGNPVARDPRPGYPFNFIAYENNVFLIPFNHYPTFSLMLYGSNLLRISLRRYFENKFGRLTAVREEVKWCSLAWQDEIANCYWKNIVKAGKIANAYGAKFAVFFQPTLYFKNHRTEQEEKLIDAKTMRHYLVLRQKILEKGKGRKLNFVDLTESYDDINETLFTDFIHTNQQGINIISNRIFNYIVSNFKIPRRAVMHDY